MSTDHPLADLLARISADLAAIRSWLLRYGDAWVTSAALSDLLAATATGAARRLAPLVGRVVAVEGRRWRLERGVRGGQARWRLALVGEGA